MPFSNLGLAEAIVRAAVERGYTEPTPVQTQAIPAVLTGGDLLAGAQTGTGKTAGFVMPMLQLLSTRAAPRAAGASTRPPIRALILTPTRELAAQVEESVREYGKYLRLSSMVVFGGVNIDYHIAIDHNYYSVPYQLVHQRVEARSTASTVEIFFKGRRVGSHARRFGRGQAATSTDHMPRSHRAHAEWTPSRIIAWAVKTGPATARMVTAILNSRPHPEQGYRACLGLLRLGKKHGADRLEAACARAHRLRAFSYRTVKNILAAGLDRVPVDETPSSPLPAHDNIRGAAYYQGD